MRQPTCCHACKGQAPHMFCRWKACDCHKKQMKAPNIGAPLYRDPTAAAAIGNLPAHLKGVNK